MASKLTRISADGHGHLYPPYRLGQAFDRLLANLDRNARARWDCDPRDTVRLAFLAEGAAGNFFAHLRDGALDPASAGLEIIEPREAAWLTLLHRGSRRLGLVAGKQVATRERLEVLGLAMSDSIPDGLPVRETIARVVAAGGIPVLPWAPGKWWGKRGRMVRELVAASAPGRLALGDSSLRPAGWPEPGIMRMARQRGFLVLPGSDPLPLPGEEPCWGSYGWTAEAPFDADHPTASIRSLLASNPENIIPAGRRNSIPEMISRLYRLRKKNKMF